MKNVMEVLDTVNDEVENDSRSDWDSDDSNSSSDKNDQDSRTTSKKLKTRMNQDNSGEYSRVPTIRDPKFHQDIRNKSAGRVGGSRRLG